MTKLDAIELISEKWRLAEEQRDAALARPRVKPLEWKDEQLDKMMHPEDRKILEVLAKELADEAGVPLSKVTIHACGRSTCKHDSDGPMVESEDGRMISASCSKCGSLAIDRAIWELP